MTLDSVFDGTFTPKYHSTSWVREAEDGTFSTTNGIGDIVLASVLEANSTRVLVSQADVIDPYTNKPISWDWWRLSPDGKFVLFRSDTRKQWRHSSHGVYWIHRLQDHKTRSLHPATFKSKVPTVSYASWAPVGHQIAFVSDNDLWVTSADFNNVDPTQVTFDGSDVVFNGVPDWVYEEEVFASDSALWWSPKGDTIAFLRSNESEVPEFKLQYYNPTSDAFAVNPYPTEVDMRYPKPGYRNPDVTVHVFNVDGRNATVRQLEWEGQLEPGARIITEVAWVGDDALIVKEIDRAARNGRVAVFTDGKTKGTVVRTLGKDGEEGDDGWIDHGQDVIPVTTGVGGYLDIVPNDGFDHIALFTPTTATKPIFLTSGDWEVSKIAGFDAENGVVYFVAANPSIDRHVYSVSLPETRAEAEADDYAPKLVPLTDTTKPGYYDVSFSPKAGFYSLSYRGPLVPWQRLLQTGDGDLDTVLEDNKQLNDTLREYHRPIETRSTLVTPDGLELNMIEILPPNLDTSGRKKYPLLIQVYGGPYSQMVDNTFKRDWHSYLASEEKYVIVRVDGRGTGFKGRALRNPIRDDLGHWEVEDQIALARELVKRKYVDRSRVGIWGWSYGGYMTLKTLEAGGDLFNLGMAVAPVTDWRYYDSIYTERYMNTPQDNSEGYVTSSVHNVTAFDGKNLLLAHGTGDDNVHFANMASLVDKLTQSRVRGWQMRVFTDSSHSIATRGANRELYEWMTTYLQDTWGKGGKH